MTVKEMILEYVAQFPGATNAEMAKRFNKGDQHINTTCRALEREGFLVRQENIEKGAIGNYLSNTEHIAETLEQEPLLYSNSNESYDENLSLQEEDIKHVLCDHLTKEGWTVQVAWGHSRGVDINAQRGDEQWLIEVKGPGSRQPMRVNYFLSILGEMLQRMDNPNARYSIALPDMKQYRGLWERLPELAKKRTMIDLLLIDSEKNIIEIKS